ncbi:MAG: DUF4177 domain-containing protein [Rhodobacteraceae bacterium]|nr:DUF4177 domain-containing protein [Paracoccaceae bacterium]
MVTPDQTAEARMQRYEYKVIPAPVRGEKTRGAKTTEERFALAMTSLINAQARDGWDYCRAETLPSEERAGFTKRRIVHVNVLVFKRALEEKPASTLVLGSAEARAPKIVPIPEGAAPKLGPAPAPDEI